MERRLHYRRTIERGGDRRLKGARILVVEDEAIVAMELSAVLEDNGAEVVGPCPTLVGALAKAAAEPLSAAILDMRLGRDSIAPVARLLAWRRIPFLFYSGQSRDDPVHMEWPDRIMISKPAETRRLLESVADLLLLAAAR